MSISKYETKAGTRYRVRYTRPDGTRSDKRGFRTKSEARKWEAKLDAGVGSHPILNEQPLAEHVDDYKAASIDFEATTKYLYGKVLDNHVLPRWGRRKATTITQAEVQRWISNSGFSHSRANQCLNVLRALIRIATHNDPNFRNPAVGITKPRKPRAQHTYLNMDQLRLLADKARYPGIVWTLGLTGLRWGELAGLRVRDVDLKNRRLHVWQNASLIEGRVVITSPKTGESRTVAMPAIVADFIGKAIKGKAADAPVWSNPDGSYLRRPSGNAWFWGATQRAKAEDDTFPKKLRVHDLRHTAASLMAQSGAHVKMIQRQLGHKSAAMTFDVYMDLFPEDLSSIMDALDRRLGGQDVGNDEKAA